MKILRQNSIGRVDTQREQLNEFIDQRLSTLADEENDRNVNNQEDSKIMQMKVDLKIKAACL
jgi:uncharacterized protein YpmS